MDKKRRADNLTKILRKGKEISIRQMVITLSNALWESQEIQKANIRDCVSIIIQLITFEFMISPIL